MSKQAIGKISALFISVKGESNRFEKEQLKLDSHGILTDKFHNTNVQRSVLITSLSSYDLALKHGITMPFGSLGENLLIDYNPYHLKAGTQLHIGSAILEISQNCTICDHLSSIDKSLPTLLKNDRGIFAKVLQEGEILNEDTIYLIA
ncbi:MAG: MOSC domain-containing protein [Sulfurovum sp.]|nr:MOSC domain-containing protein [Sulfurovum sp.]